MPAARIEISYHSSCIGKVLIERGDVTSEHIVEALRIQRVHGGALGEILTRMGACSEAAIDEALRVQLKKNEGGKESAQSAVTSKSKLNASTKLCVRTSPSLTIAIILAADVCALTSAAAIACLARYTIDGGLHPLAYLRLWPALLLFNLSFALWHLYPAVAISPAEEFRRTTWLISLIYLTLVAATHLSRSDAGYSRIILGTAWILSIIAVPLLRSFVRYLFARKAWWGHPILVMGAGESARRIVGRLVSDPGISLKPVAILDDDHGRYGSVRVLRGHRKIRVQEYRNESDSRRLEEVPIVGGLNLAPTLAKDLCIKYAIIAMPELSNKRLLELVERYGGMFTHLTIIPDLFGCSSLQVVAKDVGGILGLEVRQQLLLPRAIWTKRFSDIVLTLLGGLMVFPFLLVLAILIKLDSAGPALYVQSRLGKNGRRFNALKFRTMYGNGEERLKEILDGNAELAAEYRIYHKLKKDPRVTRIGRFLRKFSLDEMPQLWNVLCGEMSLIGPRPYIEREVPEMGESSNLILKSLPGMSGMWQVSGRNDSNFSERVNMDVYYVRNWSLWLDLYILIRTFGVVIRGSGT